MKKEIWENYDELAWQATLAALNALVGKLKDTTRFNLDREPSYVETVSETALEIGYETARRFLGSRDRRE